MLQGIETKFGKLKNIWLKHYTSKVFVDIIMKSH